MTTYYVDATGGDDGALGTSELTAWQTMGKVNGSAFVAGDSVLFKRGETWTGTRLTITWSGSADTPIVFGAYGTGARPVIDGNDTVNCIANSGVQHHITIQDIECTQGLDFGISFNGACYNIQVIDCACHDCGNDGLIFQNGVFSSSITRGTFFNSYQRVPDTQITGIEVTDGSHDVLIDRVECYGNLASTTYGSGITIHNHDATTMPYNIVVQDCYCHDNSAYGIHINKQGAVADADRNIAVWSCRLEGNYTGLRIRRSATATQYINGVTVDSCHSQGNTLYAYHLLGDNLTIRRSVFDGAGLADSCVALKFYNNTLYLPTGAGAYPLYLTNARTASVEIKNCIVYCQTSGGMAIGVDATVGAAAVAIDYNLYYLAAEAITALRWNWLGTAYGYADWLTNSGQDANSPAPANPLFESVPADDFHLKTGSPAINTGTDLGLFYSGAAPDLGAFERWASRGATWLHLAGVHEEDD